MVPPGCVLRPGGDLVRPPWTMGEATDDWMLDLVGGRGPLLEIRQELEEDPDVLELTDAILQAQLEKWEDVSEPGEPDPLQEESSQPGEGGVEEDLDLPVVGDSSMGEVQETSETAAGGASTSSPVGEALATLGDLPGSSKG